MLKESWLTQSFLIATKNKLVNAQLHYALCFELLATAARTFKSNPVLFESREDPPQSMRTHEVALFLNVLAV